ncbi:abc transporter [Apiospora arundinis]|uniref:Abc transporter n=1 Tax=Apiospora arundinis TaxID=335852 RepID=A0ABR2HRM0_9PEZI
MASEPQEVAPEPQKDAWFLKYTFPVTFPSHPALTLAGSEFDNFLLRTFRQPNSENAPVEPIDMAESESFTLLAPPSTTAELQTATEGLKLDDGPAQVTETKSEGDNSPTGPFMKGLLSHEEDTKMEQEQQQQANSTNLMFTKNHDIAYRSTENPVLDLFTELEEVISGPRLYELLNMAWERDPLMTLKIIYNARSVHLGKASRTTFYRSAGWLAQYHPHTLVSNLRWLSRPVMAKKAEKPGGDGNSGDDFEVVEAEHDKDDQDACALDVKNGLSHGYWKDLLNILALSVNGQLTVLANPKDILNVTQEKTKERSWKKHVDAVTAKAKRHEVRHERHERAVNCFNQNPVHRALHIAIARLFSEQLKADLALLRGPDAKEKKHISLCAKWAPSHDRFHDKHTFIVSTIAELMHPEDRSQGMDREIYLRHAREAYRKDISALRAHLDIVERHLSAKTLDKIKYDRVPSIAMNRYTPVFAEKDTENFEKYINKVAEGRAKISGATLLPSSLIKTVRLGNSVPISRKGVRGAAEAKVEAKLAELNCKVVDAQWKTLVQRIKDSGNLESSMAVCDVSGSMRSPQFADGTCPMDSAIGLSLLLAEVAQPPFDGAFITFSETPTVERVDLTKTLHDKYQEMSWSAWGMNTNFVAVFEDLVLPVAVRNKLKPEDMVKRIFVFSDMQFDAAESVNGHGEYHRDHQHTWGSSYERIKRKFSDAGYEIPQLVFWNLAGGRAGYPGGDPTAPKPVGASEEGTAIVSGYSQGMLKLFLDNGSFEDAEEEEEEGDGELGRETVPEDESDEDGILVDVDPESPPASKRKKMDPMSILKRAIGHKAYGMLKVVD